MKGKQKKINKIPYWYMMQAEFESTQVDKAISAFNHCALLSVK